MKNTKNILTKIWLILTVAIILGGVVLLSVLGFNNTVDYSKGYELKVGVTHNIDNQDLISEVTESFFKENNLSNEEYSKVFLNDGSYVVYRFRNAVEIDKDALKTKVQESLNNELAVVSVELNEFKTNRTSNVWFFALALLISAVVIFLLTLILGKAKIAIITAFASIASMITYLGMVSLFRVPICDFLGVFTALSFVFAMILATILAFNFRQINNLQTNEKISSLEVANRGVKNNLFKFACIGCTVLILAIAMLIFGGAYLKFVALHLILASISSFAVTLIGVPFSWTLGKQK